MNMLAQFGNSEQKTMGTREIANLCEKNIEMLSATAT